MKDLIEVIWHARGGQGAKTASLIFAEAFMNLGKYIQAFPEYGPERTGAPIKAFNRISSKPIRNYSAIEEADVIVILDPTLLRNRDLSLAMKSNGILIVNTEKKLDGMKAALNCKNIVTIPASNIAKKYLGKNIPNTVMLGFLFKVLGLSYNDLKTGIEKRLKVKFKNKPEFINKNLRAIKEAYNG